MNITQGKSTCLARVLSPESQKRKGFSPKRADMDLGSSIALHLLEDTGILLVPRNRALTGLGPAAQSRAPLQAADEEAR